MILTKFAHFHDLKLTTGLLTYNDAQSLRIEPLKKKKLITKIIQKQLQFQRVYNK